MRRDDASEASHHDDEPSGRPGQDWEDESRSILIELEAVPRSVSEVEEVAGRTFRQIKHRPEFADYTDVQLAELYRSIENAVFEAWTKRHASGRAMRRVGRELSKLGRALSQVGENYRASGAG